MRGCVILTSQHPQHFSTVLKSLILLSMYLTYILRLFVVLKQRCAIIYTVYIYIEMQDYICKIFKCKANDDVIVIFLF